MKSIQFYIIATLCISVNAFAVDPVWYDKPLEPKFQYMIKAKDYYQGTYAFNTFEPCKGTNCIPAGATVGCSSYSLVDTNEGTQIQFCHINTIQYSKSSKAVDVSTKDYVMATGFVAENKKFILGLPSGQIFTASRPSQKTEAAVCDGNCGTTGAGNKISELAKSVVDIVTPEKTPSSITKEIGDAFATKVKEGKFNPACTEFIESDGSLGPYGVKVLAALKKVGWKYFDGGELSINVNSVCPNFKKFSNVQKEYFYAWVFASMAQEESSCNPKSEAKGRNDFADGLFQMEFSASQRRNAGRDKKFCPYNGVNTKDITFQIECSASIMKDISLKLPNKDITGKGGYWSKMRGTKTWSYRDKRGKIHKVVPEISWHMMDFPGCGKTSPQAK